MPEKNKDIKITVEELLVALGSLAESDTDKIRIKGIREWASRITGTPYHSEITEEVTIKR